MTLLTVAELKLHLGNVSLDDAALQQLLDAAETAIAERVGPLGHTVETHQVSGWLIPLNHRATSIDYIDENRVRLEASDYRLRPSGMVVERVTWPRLSTTWPYHRRYRLVDVAYYSTDDTADRVRVQIGLVKLDMSFTPGTSEERIGEWMERSSTQQGITYAQLREEYLSSLAAAVPV